MKSRMVLALCMAGLGCSGDRSEALNNNLGTGGRDAEVADDGAVVDAGADVDAEPNDAGSAVDAAAEPDASTVPTGFRVRMHSRGRPLPGRMVLLHAADGAITAQLVTDASGVVFSETAPAMATVRLAAEQYQYGYFSQLLTFTGTKEGDDLEIAVVEEETIFERTLYFAQLVDPWPSASYVSVGTTRNCATGYADSSSEMPFSVPMYATCGLPAEGNTMLATAYDGDSSPSLPRGFAVARNVVGPAQEPINVPFGAWLEPREVLVRMSGEPPIAASSVQADLAMVIDGQRFDAADVGGEYPEPTQFRVAPEIVAGLEVRVGFFGSTSNGNITHRLMRSVPEQQEVTVSFADALPQVEAGSFDATDPLRPVFGFTAPSTLERVDAVYSVLELRGETMLRWGFVSPPEQRTITAPMLPTALISLADIDPARSSLQSVTLVGSDALTGYDAFRARPFTPVQSSEPDDMVLWTLSSAENAQLSSWYPVGI